jgi:hypothetical protein
MMRCPATFAAAGPMFAFASDKAGCSAKRRGRARELAEFRESQRDQFGPKNGGLPRAIGRRA